MADPAVLGHAMGLAPKEAVEFLLGRELRVNPDGWREVWESANSRAFTVARMAQNDLLAETYAVVGRKLAKGLTGEQAAQELAAAFRRKGWIGVGEGGARLGSPARARLIVRTNAAAAYAAGRYRRQRENAEDRPIWRYDAVLDDSTRPSHAELDGQAWRHDDPIWDSIYPPNGFNCRCSVQALTEDQAKRRGDVEVNPSSAAESPQGREAVQWRTPAGKERTFAPDPGWAYNPGAHGPEIARTADRRATPVRWMPTYKQYGRPDTENLAPRTKQPELLPKADSRQDAVQQIAKEVGMGDAERLRIDTPFRQLEMRRRGVRHVADDRQDAREQLAARILPTFEDPDEVWLALYAVRDGRRDRPEVRTHYVKVWDKDGSFGLGVEDRAGNVLWTWFEADWEGLNQRRRGILVYAADRDGK